MPVVSDSPREIDKTGDEAAPGGRAGAGGGDWPWSTTTGLREAILIYKYTCVIRRRYFVMSGALTCPLKWTRQWTRQWTMHFGLCRMHDSGPVFGSAKSV